MNAPTNTANNVATAGPVIISNNLAASSELKVKIVTTANGASTNLLIFPGPVPKWLVSKLSCTECEQTEIKLSSSISANNANGLVDFKAYLASVGMFINKMRFVTATTDIYTGSLFIGEVAPNGFLQPQEIPLQPYANTLGGGSYDKALEIADMPFSTTKNFYMYLSSMPASATLDIYFTVSAIGNTVTVK